MAIHMFLKVILGSVIVLTGSTVNSQATTKCLPGDEKCYTLYRGDLTWQEAYDECSSRNQHLATIQDTQTQSITQQFALDQRYTDPAHAWVAGRRSDDMTWRDLNGEVFNSVGDILSEDDSSRLCMLLNGSPRFAADGPLHLAVLCYDATAYKAVCEYDPPAGAGCPEDNITIHQPSVNKCNTVSRVKYQSFYDAKTYCQNKSWELAHTGAGSWDFYNKLTLTDKPLIRDEPYFWIDVQRRLWVWIINGTEEIYLGTTYWRSQDGVYSTEGCMHIELNDRGLWADKPCDVTSSYYFCEHNKDQTSIVPPATSKTTPTAYPTSPSTTVSPSEDKNTTISTKPSGDADGLTTPVTSMPRLSSTETHDKTTDGSTGNLTLSPAPSTGLPLTTVYIIVGVAGGVVVVVIIIIVAVVCARRRRKENPSLNTTAATEVENPPQTDLGDDPQPYAEVRQFNNSPEQNTPEDPTSPYPLYDEAAAVRIDRIPTPELYYKAADEKDPMAPEFTGSDRAVSSGESGPSQIVTNDGDVYSLPVKKSSLKQDDDLEIIDNPTYGAA